MKEYFKRLRAHPGIGVACLFTVIGFVAGAENKSFPGWWQGGLFGMAALGSICWGAVLLTNVKNRK